GIGRAEGRSSRLRPSGRYASRPITGASTAVGGASTWRSTTSRSAGWAEAGGATSAGTWSRSAPTVIGDTTKGGSQDGNSLPGLHVGMDGGWRTCESDTDSWG